jgi:hypothetical protein
VLALKIFWLLITIVCYGLVALYAVAAVTFISMVVDEVFGDEE